MKNDKFCVSKTLSYLVALVVAVVGAFYVMNYANTQKLGSTPKAAGTLSARYRFSRLGENGRVISPDRSAFWPNQTCEYRLRSYKEGSKTLTENAYTGYMSDGTNLTKDVTCYPFIYANRDLRFNYSYCVVRANSTNWQYSEYCRERTNTQGDVKVGSLFYSYGVGSKIYQSSSVKLDVSGRSGKWWVGDNSTLKFTSKIIIDNERKFEGFPAYIAGSDPNYVAPVVVKKCTYNGKTVKFADDSLNNGEYYMNNVTSGIDVTKGQAYSVMLPTEQNDRLTAIECIPLDGGVANEVSWRSKGGEATVDLNKQTCLDNAEKTYTVTVGGTQQTKTIKASCKYKTRSGKEVSVEYGNYIDSTNTIKCDCDLTGKYTYPTFVQIP